MVRKVSEEKEVALLGWCLCSKRWDVGSGFNVVLSTRSRLPWFRLPRILWPWLCSGCANAVLLELWLLKLAGWRPSAQKRQLQGFEVLISCYLSVISLTQKAFTCFNNQTLWVEWLLNTDSLDIWINKLPGDTMVPLAWAQKQNGCGIGLLSDLQLFAVRKNWSDDFAALLGPRLSPSPPFLPVDVKGYCQKGKVDIWRWKFKYTNGRIK